MPIKPDQPTVFHGSGTRGLKSISPRQESVRDPKEGPVVFGTSRLRLACMFMSPDTRDSWTKKGSFSNTYYFIISNEKRYRDGDKGGSIYELPADTFYREEGKGMQIEYVSKTEVPIIKEREFDSTLDALLWCGVQVYFIDPETLQKIWKAPDNGLDILKTLTSENMKQGKNVQQFI
ncbi:MAG: hypothetical protein RJB39_253 [Candidatus Parcubacteria bacterium]|jgi:hypothetical protein